MNTEDAVAILEMLMEGVDPISGEIFPEEHACHEQGSAQDAGASEEVCQ